VSDKDEGAMKLCKVLFGEVRAWQYAGGGNANMLFAAAEEIERLRSELHAARADVVLLRSRIAEMELRK